MARYVVARRDPGRIAGAVIRFQVDRPSFLVPALIAVVVLAAAGTVVGSTVFGSTPAGGEATGRVVGGVVGGAVCLLFEVGGIAVTRRQLGRVMAARGYRPGSMIEAEFDDAGFSVATGLGTGLHSYSQICDGRLVGDVVVLRLAARTVVALPAELVPDDRLPALAAAASRPL